MDYTVLYYKKQTKMHLENYNNLKMVFNVGQKKN